MEHQTAYEKTRSLGREFVQTDLLDANPDNPNKMSPREFDLLVANAQETGLSDPILVRPIEGGRYRIIGGHHRWEAAKYLEFPEVPVTILTDPEFDDDREAFQLVRMNVIRGKLDPSAFVALYSKMKGKYADDVLQESFGFADEKEFRRLVAQTAKGLPEQLKEKFLEGAKELKTIDDLASLLNGLFSKYGDTLPYGFMVLDYGGQQSVWIRCQKAQYKVLESLGDWCIENQRSLDDVVHAILSGISAEGAEMDVVRGLTPEVKMPPGHSGLPTKAALGY